MPTLRPISALRTLIALFAALTSPFASQSLAQAPANDLCENAIDLNSVAKPYSSGAINVLNATIDANANPACDSPGNGPGANRGIWWKYTTGTTSERITFQLPPGVGADHVISMWTGPNCNELSPYICSDGDQTQQGLVIVLAKNSSFYIMSSLWSGNMPTGTTNLGLFMSAPLTVADQPSNGPCEGATHISTFPFTSPSTNYSTSFGSPYVPTCGTPTYITNRTPGGVWYTFTPAVPTVLTLREPGSEDVTFSVWTGSCDALTQVFCGDGGAGTTEAVDVGPLEANIQHYILLSRGGTTPASRSWPALGANISLNATAVLAPPAAPNDLCANSKIITTLPFDSGLVNAFSNTNDANTDPTCDAMANPGAGVRGVWFTYTTGAAPAAYILKETGSLDVVASLWTGADCDTLTSVACDDTAIDTSTGWIYELGASTTYHLMISQAGSTPPALSDTYRVTMSRIAPPANDTCQTAISFNVPGNAYAQSNLDVRSAQSDLSLSCNTPAGSPTRHGIWHKVTPAAGDTYTLTIGETSSEDTIRAVFSGGCDALTEIACSDVETGVLVPIIGGTTYYILTGSAGASATLPVNNFTFTASATTTTSACCTATACTVISNSACTAANGTWRGPSPVTCSVATNLATACRPAPTHDLCANAINVTDPFPRSFSTPIPAAATDDRQISCNTGTSGVAAARFGVWYSYTSGADAGTLRFSQTGSLDTLRAVFTGTCDNLVEKACFNDEANQSLAVAPNTRYYLLLALPGGGATPASSYELRFDSFTAAVGACCNALTCTVVSKSACAGAWRGSGTTCTVEPTYSTALVAPIPITDASLVGVSVPLEVSGADQTISSLKVQVTFGTHTYAGDLILRVTGPNGASVDLFARPGGSSNCNPPTIALAGSSNDLNAGTYIFDENAATTLATAILTGSRSGGTYKPATCANQPQSLNTAFQAMSPNGTWTLTAFDLSAGDTGTITNFGLIVNGVVFSPCDHAGACCTGYACAVVLQSADCSGAFFAGQSCAPNSCLPPIVTCCRGATCTLLAPAECTAPSTVGLKLAFDTPCNTTASSTTPCCFADFDKSGLVNIDDVFIYLNAWFGTESNSFCRIGGDGFGIATFEDLLIFINIWFQAGC
jgi:subtilisin-like proprotein convertase family protein